MDIDNTESCLIRTDDILCLVSVFEDETLTRGYLASEGYGARMCHLEQDRNSSGDASEVPNELWKCAFRIAKCCSVHELRRGTIEKRQTGNVLIYGHAVQLEHLSSGLLLSCLATSSSADKQAFDVGLVDSDRDLEENCWFSVHPISQQRSEGEKVREGDDVVLVNIANERYLSVHLGPSLMSKPESSQLLVQTSFGKCAWSLQMFRLGSAKDAAIGYANGGDVISVVLQGSSECLSVPLRRCDKLCHKQVTSFKVVYSSAREEVKSLWRIELPTLKFGGAFNCWRQPFRLRHVVSGLFLCVQEESPCLLTLCCGEEASKESSLFCFRRSWGELAPATAPGGKGGVMGEPCVKFGDCTLYLQHVHSKMWLGYPSMDRLNKSDSDDEREARLLKDPHANFAFTVTRATEEQIRATMLVNFSYLTIREYVAGLLDPSKTINIPSDMALHKKMDSLLDILTCYFNPLTHQDQRLRSSLVRKRQNLFMRQGSLMMIVSVMDRIFKQSKWNADKFLDTQKRLYHLLVAMIKGNNGSCAEFAVKNWFDEFIRRLQKSPLTHELLAMLHCVLEDSPQAVHLISDSHIKSLVALLAKKGCDEKILTFLTSLCVLQGIAIRDKQRSIAKHALTNKNLFLASTLQQGVVNYHLRPVYLSSVDKSAMSRKWYFEVLVKYSMSSTLARQPVVRVGWAHPDLYMPFATSNGFQVTGGSIGHDLHSVGCDGCTVWVSECDVLVAERRHSLRRQANLGSSDNHQTVIGCTVDLDVFSFQFYVNGRLLSRPITLPQMNLTTPACSVSAGVSVEFFLGGELGEFIHPPPPGYTPLVQLLNHKQDVVLAEFVTLGNLETKLYRGPSVKNVSLGFVPTTIDTSKISLPDKLWSLRVQLAEHIHDVWSVGKISAGWVFGQTRNDTLKHHPCLKSYDELSENEKRYDYNLAFETIATLIGLGYEVVFDHGSLQAVSHQSLDPDHYRLSNGYLPRPIDLAAVTLPKSVLPLIERMAENIHSIWAVDRIEEGWTYGSSEDCQLKQNPSLVPYLNLEEKVKESNRSTALESFKCLYAFGARIVPPEDSNSSRLEDFSHESIMYNQKKRTIRGQMDYGQMLTEGQWYFEVTVLTSGSIRVGWAKPAMHPESGLGEDEDSFAFEGSLGRKLHGSSSAFGRPWRKNDTVGCLLDCDARTMSFALNGAILTDSFEDPIAFSQFSVEGGFLPAVTLGPNQEVKINFGKNEDTQLHKLENYGFGPSSGYLPISKNAYRSLPLWYSVDYPVVQTLRRNNHPRLTLTRRNMGVVDGSHCKENILVSVRDDHTPVFSRLECVRLNSTVCLFSDPTSHSGQQGDLGHLLRQASLSQEIIQGSVESCSCTMYIPSGQDPRHVLVGWTAPDFVFSPSTLTSSLAHTLDSKQDNCVDQAVKIGTADTKSQSTTLYSSAFLLPLLYLVEESQAFMSVEITSVVNTKTRQIEFYVEGTVVKTLLVQTKADIKLYPTVVISPSPETSHLLSFIITEPCSRQVNVLVTETSRWASMPEHNQNHTVRTDGPLGLTCDTSSPSISILVPWEDRVFPLKEIIEDKKLTNYYVATLGLLEGLAAHPYSKSTTMLKINEVLGQEELMLMMQLRGLPYKLSSSVVSLVRVLFIKEKVTARSFMKEENIVHIPSRKAGEEEGSSFFGWSEQEMENMKEGHLSASSLGVITPGASSSEDKSMETLNKLKDIAFSRLHDLLRVGEATCTFMSTESRVYLIKPLVELCDDLLVAGVLSKKTEVELLLSVLNPSVFPVPQGHSTFTCGLLMNNLEEPIKLAICRLLHHVHDCQLSQRLHYVVAYSESLVGKIRKEQEGRYANGDGRRSREFMSTPEHQMRFILTPGEGGAASPGPGGAGRASVLEDLHQFHSALCQQCGVLDVAVDEVQDDQTIRDRLHRLYTVLSKESTCQPALAAPLTETETSKFHSFVTNLLMKWSQMELSDRVYIKELFSLLYRQHNMAAEVGRALRRTFVVQLSREAVNSLFEAVGSLRSLLTVGMGVTEEKALKDSLRKITQSQAFKENAELMRFLKVHLTTLSLLKDYLGVTEVRGKEWKKKRVRKKDAVLQGMVSETVQACCTFLYSFTLINEHNQIAMFDHMDFLLKCTETNPELLNFTGHGPIDVASAVIHNNDELVLFLREGQLEGVVKLLSQQFTKHATLCAATVKSNDIWTMRGANKCLEFLSSAVWCKGKYVKENALVVIRLLLRHSECLDPIVSNQQGLSDLFHSALFQDYSFDRDRALSPLSPTARHRDHSSSDDDETASRKSSEFSSSTHRSSSVFAKRMTQFSASPSTVSMASSAGLLMADSEGATLRFLADLLRLLGYCAPSISSQTQPDAGDGGQSRRMSRQDTSPQALQPVAPEDQSGSESLEASITRHTHSLLRDLIDRDDILEVLNIALSTAYWDKFNPLHKEACLLFFERVYGIEDPEQLHSFISSVCLPDLKFTISVASSELEEEESQRLFVLCEYVTDHLLPVISKKEHLLEGLDSDLAHDTIEAFLLCCYQFSVTVPLSPTQRTKVASFLTTVCRAMKPGVLLHLMPKIINDLPQLQPKNITTLKFLTQHYTHFKKYYHINSGWKTAGCGAASDEERRFSSSFCFKLLHQLCFGDLEFHVLSYGVRCLKAVVAALHPSMCINVREASWDALEYRPQLLDVSKVVLTSSQEVLVENFCAHLHDTWSQEKLSDGWQHGQEYSEALQNHPSLVHYKQLSQKERDARIVEVVFMVKVLLAKGFGIIASKNKHTTDLSMAFDNVTDFSASQYTPSPVDLSQVKVPRLFTQVSRKVAQWSHEQWAAQIMKQDRDYKDHPDFKPYDDLDEDTKEDKRTMPLDLFKFISLSGYTIVRTRAQTWAKEGMLLSEDTERFATLLFSTLLEVLRAKEKHFTLPKAKVMLSVVLPVLTDFLSSNSLIFHCSGSSSVEDLPKKEKALVIKLLAQVWHFCQQNYTTICLRRTASLNSPQTTLNISTTSGCLSSLCRTLQLQEFVTSKMLSSEEMLAVQEFLDGALLELETAQHQAKELSLPMFDFTFRVIVPSLAAFFRCLTCRKEHKVLQTKLGSTALRIFHCVYDFGRRGLTHFSHSTSEVYSAVGGCLSAFIEAYPARILEASPAEGAVISVAELAAEVEQASKAGQRHDRVQYTEAVVLPLLCSYIGKYWIVQLDHKQSCLASQVTVDQIDKLVLDISRLVLAFFEQDSVPWMFRAVGLLRPMLQCCSGSLLEALLLPAVQGLRGRTLRLWQNEVFIGSRWSTSSQEFGLSIQALLEQYAALSRDLVVCTAMLIVFLDARDGLRDLENCGAALDQLFESLAEIFHAWFSSPHLKREFLSQQGLFLKIYPNFFSVFRAGNNESRNTPAGAAKRSPASMVKICMARLLKCKTDRLSERDKLVLGRCMPHVESKALDTQSLKAAVLEEVLKAGAGGDQPGLLTRSPSLASSVLRLTQRATVGTLVGVIRVQHRLQQAEAESAHKPASKWKSIKVLTDTKRKAITRCFMSVPYFKLSMTRALNILLHTYQDLWFGSIQKGSHMALKEKLLVSKTSKGQKCPLTQLLQFFGQEALAGQVPAELYCDYVQALSLYCNVFIAEDDMDEDDPTINYKKFAEMRARLLENQMQLCNRSGSVTILQVLATTGGLEGCLARMSIHLGIALLKGGNDSVQKVMLKQLGTMDGEVLKCVESLIASCSVLRWEGHERSGYSSLEGHATGNLPDYKFIWSLFRFLQLLCEGHNEEFQNYLRTQDNNTATINIVVCSVDYLLRLQESISDYCWYLSDNGVVGSHRREALNRALMLSNQVLRTLTEYIQGPCIGNQQAMASSRMWDAASGFLKMFASLQWKLGKNSNQIELLLDMMKVQKSLFTFLQSMLEGVEMNSLTARIMANMLVEQSSVVMDIIQFYNMFLELKDLVTAQAFKEYDLNGDGWISRTEFQRAMEVHSSYTPSEIDYIMDCADLDRDGRLDYLEFTRRFHSPAEQIGFDLCVLVTTLSEHLPGNRGIEALRLSKSTIFAYFEKSLGRIEIVGKSGNVERVYFEIKPWWMMQWKERQVQDSKREFIQNLDVHSQRQKLGAFIEFCEDTIFEIQHAAKINEIESQEEIEKAEHHRKQHLDPGKPNLKLSKLPTKTSSSTRVLVFVLWLLTVLRTSYWPRFRSKCMALWHSLRVAVAPKNQLNGGVAATDLQTGAPAANGSYGDPPATPTSTTTPARAAPQQAPCLPEFNRAEIKPPSECADVEMDSVVLGNSSSSKCSSSPMISARHRLATWSSTLARRYYQLHFILLVLTSLINVCLLKYKITSDSLQDCIQNKSGEGCSSGKAAPTWITIVSVLLSCTHTTVAGVLLVSYYHLKIPLLLFKREKQIARKLEFSRTWLSVPAEGYQEQWDRLVLKSPMFPRLLWDKQLKSRLVAQHGQAAKGLFGESRSGLPLGGASVWRASWDVLVAVFDQYLRYHLWTLGVLATNLPLLYRAFGLLVSVLGLVWSPFFFSIHLLDFIWSSTDLQNVLKSVMLNYRQVLVTILMTCTVVYLYTVVAFNMFQKYYLTPNTDSVVPNCDTMTKCFLYHLNHGLRSGGGIADVIATAVDDDMEGIRLVFDMSFFFFVIIILLAIIQGLIIDSFGKLRNKEEAQKEEMQTHCFICGLQKDKLEEIPHGFEQHTQKEHHMAHYMFFLMHLIQKPETEFTGQESHVWEHYCHRKWDFFPVAESFRHRKTQNTTAVNSQ